MSIQTPTDSRGFKIISDASGNFQPIDAICQFLYRGYQISISTTGLSKGACHQGIAVYGGNDYNCCMKDNLSTVQNAIDYVNSLRGDQITFTI